MTNFVEALPAKAKQANSVEELLTLSKENNIELTVEQAKEYFEQLNPKSSEIADDELSNVAGGTGFDGKVFEKATMPINGGGMYK